MLKWILNKIVGSKNQREVRRLRPIVKKITDIEQSWGECDQAFLRAKTEAWQKALHAFTPMDLPSKGALQSATDEQLTSYAAQLETRFTQLRSNFPKLPTVAASIESIEAAKDEFHKAEPRFEKLRAKYLEDILPEAFAVVKCGARAMCGSKIDVAGTELSWDMVHFDVQLLGGIALHRGFITEMATGEGKTLVATLPVYLNALTGMGVHVVTVNDYLARRDSAWMGSLYGFLGLSVGCIQSQMPNDARRRQYLCDITYGTNSEFGFDYLRDNGMANSKDAQVQRGHYFAVIDEVDSILIDEARTPLIISGPALVERELQYDELKPLIQQVVAKQEKLCDQLMTQAHQFVKDGNPEAAGRNLFKVRLGMPRNTAFMLSQQHPDMRRMLEKAELFLYQDPRKIELYKLKEELYFCIDEKTHDADLMEMGREVISPGHPEAFVLPDIGTEFAALEEDLEMTEREREARKGELLKRLDGTGARLHTTSQLLKAYAIYLKDVEYVVRDGEIIIIDQNTGREMPGRRWSDGLHQAIEAKEDVKIEAENMTYATITIQNYFRLYAHLGGMTGTAETEAAEFHDIYRLDVLPIPTNRPNIRQDLNDLIFKSRREKNNAVVAKIAELHKKGQPVLIGTASVDASEDLSRMLHASKIPHEVLNAKNHQYEADIVARAGQKGAVTVSTNMAGRGTDIKLGEGVRELGGLFVLGTERYESRRIDRQLRGRCSRQGDPGGSQFMLSFEDDLMRNFGGSERMTKMMDRFGMDDGEAVESGLMNKIIEGAQKRVEQRNYMWRKHVLDYDNVSNQQRAIVYDLRNSALLSEDPRELIFEILEEGTLHKCNVCLDSDAGEVGKVDLLQWVNSTFPLGWSKEDANFDNKTPEEAANLIVERVKETYNKKIENERAEHVENMERGIILQSVDKLWQQHITDMDALREGVRLRAQGQKDPLVEYKAEAYEIFETLMHNIEFEVLNGLFRSTTSLNAFEDFLASLPTSQAEDDGLDFGDLLGGDGGDLLSSLRERLGNIKNQVADRADAVASATADPAPAENYDPSQSFTGTTDTGAAVKGKPMFMPKQKKFIDIKRAANAPEMTVVVPMGAMGPEVEGDTIATIDSSMLMAAPVEEENQA